MDRAAIEALLKGADESDWREATLAAFEAGSTYDTLLPFMRPKAIVDARTLRRAIVMVGAIREISRGPYVGTNLVPPLLSTTIPARKKPDVWAAHGDELVETAIGFMARKGYELVAADVIRSEVDDATLEKLFRRIAERGPDAVEAADVELRRMAGMKGMTAAAKARAKVSRAALGVQVQPDGPRLPLKEGPGTDGGPLLVVPEEATRDWEGTFGDPKAPATDYDRACDVSAARVGLLDVGDLRGLVLGHTGCRWAVLRDGRCLFVLEGMSDEIGAALDTKDWRKVSGAFDVPSGKVIVFDATAAGAKTREKKALKLAPGNYAVHELHRSRPWLWVVRLTLASR